MTTKTTQDEQPRRVPELLNAVNQSGMNMNEVADAAGIHVSILSRVLNRYQKLDEPQVAKLAEVLKVKTSDLAAIIR